MYKKFGIILVLIIFLLPVSKIASAVDTAGEPNPDVPTSYIGSQQINDIKTIVGKNTPTFLSTPIIWIVNTLEDFRQTSFNNVFIFYGIFLILLFIIVRSIWRFFF